MTATDALGIVELVDVCERWRSINMTLFEQLGGWVRATPPGRLQRLFAEACHRHASHARLWERRRPTIAVDIADRQPATIVLDGASGYVAMLTRLLDQVTEQAERIDTELDPSTARVIDIVTRDLTDLRARISGAVSDSTSRPDG
jgi:hypothetical protein